MSFIVLIVLTLGFIYSPQNSIMFGDLMGNIEQQQAEMQKKMAGFVVESKVEGITIMGNAAKQITNISIDTNIIETKDKEMLEDLLITCFNKFIMTATKIEADETQKMMNEMLPPGFENMFK